MSILRTLGDALAFAVALARVLMPEPRPKQPPLPPAKRVDSLYPRDDVE